MTTPTQAKHRTSGGPRTYAWPPLPPHEFEVFSVTSAINAGMAKPFLMNWAAKLVAETAVEDLELISLMVGKGDEQGAIAHLKGAPYRKRQAAADRGTLVHSAIESYVAGKKITDDELLEQLKEKGVPEKLHAQTLLMVSGLIDFLFDEEPEILWSEATVYNRTEGYAGTADMFARMRVGGTTVPVVVDVKTSKAIYDEVAMQLAAYARADFVGLDDGNEVPLLVDEPADTNEKIEYGVVVRPKPTGGYEKAVFTLSDDVFQCFLHCLGVTRFKGAMDSARRPS